MVDVAKFFMEFIQSESCGKCIPCREGTRADAGDPRRPSPAPRRKEEDIDALLRFQGVMHLQELGETIKRTSPVRPGPDRAQPGAQHPALVPRRVRGAHLRAALPGRRLQGAGRRALPERLPGGHRGLALRGAHRPRRVRRRPTGSSAQANPFPSVCARVCHHPCETICRCGATGGEPIAIRTLKRFVVDRVDPGGYKPVVKPARPDAPRSRGHRRRARRA